MPARKAKVGVNGALVRLGFEKSSSKIKDLPAGSTVDVVETKGERCRLRSPAGWVSAKTLEFEPEMPLSPVLSRSPPKAISPPKQALDVQLSQRSTALEKALDTTPKAKPKKRAAKKAKSAAFDEQEPFELSGAVVRCWVHSRTGCRVRLVSAPGPMANLYGVLATEATEEAWCKADDGLPHTLEHLVFLGSEDYPYKGVLDKLANRCLARGTNAWTDVDHTAYTVTTAGTQGLLNLLPIYVDHMLRPTLTDEGFVTEIHHVTGEGENKGVVYCEMQGRENSAESVAERACLGALYDKTGYASETGGICDNIRKLENKTIQRYHSEFYRAENLCLIVTGGVDAGQLLDVVDEALARSWPAEKVSSSKGLTRPWTTPVPPPTLPYASRDVVFPSADEETGLVVCGWRASKYGDPHTDCRATLLWQYLCDGAASPMTKRFVDEGLCSGVFPSGDTFRIGYRQVWFDDVATDSLERVQAEFDAALKEQSNKGIDPTRMRDIIARQKRKTLAACEDDPCALLVSPVLKHFIYADQRDETTTLKELGDALGLLEYAQSLDTATWDADLQKLASSADERVWVVSRPSAAEAARQRDEEESRKQATIKREGPEGLKALQTKLDKAQEVNERDIPSEMLSCVPEPDLEEATTQLFDVQSFPGSTALTKSAEAWVSPGQQWALDHVAGTQFCRVDVCCDTRGLSPHLREFLPLLSEVLLKAPTYDKDGSVVSADDNISQLRRRTVSYGCGTGLLGSGTSWGFFVGCKVDRASESYKGGADIVRTILTQTDIFDEARVDQAVAKMSLELQSALRDGGTVARMALHALVFDRVADNGALLAYAAQRAFLREARFSLSKLGTLLGRRKAFLRDFGSLALALFDPSTQISRVAGDLLGGVNPISAESLDTLSQTPSKAKEAFQMRCDQIGTRKAPRSEPAKPSPVRWGRLTVVGVGSLEGGSAFLNRCALGPSAQDPLKWSASLAVALEYLNALEGDFWVKIRGAGLAYGASLRADSVHGLIYFGLYRSASPKEALDAAKQIVAGYADGSTPIRSDDFANARGSLASGLVEGEKTRSQALFGAWRRALLNQDSDRNRQLIKAVGSVSERDALDAIRTWVAPLFDDACACTAIACAPAKVETLRATLLDNKRLAASPEVYDDSTLEAMVGRKPELSLAKKAGLVALGAAAAVAVLRARRAS
jgi:Zn-dependent M16 (insulinase) family peptidase